MQTQITELQNKIYSNFEIKAQNSALCVCLNELRNDLKELAALIAAKTAIEEGQKSTILDLIKLDTDPNSLASLILKTFKQNYKS